MAYRTKIEVRTGGKKYLPGTILPEDISPLDLAFLKRKKFVEVVDADPLATLAAEDSDEDPDNDGFTDGFGGVVCFHLCQCKISGGKRLVILCFFQNVVRNSVRDLVNGF